MGFPVSFQANGATVSPINVGLLHSTSFTIHYSQKSYQDFLFLLDDILIHRHERQSQFKAITVCHYLGAREILLVIHNFIVFIHILCCIGSFCL